MSTAPAPTGLDFSKFGSMFNPDNLASAAPAAARKPQAKIWLNFGYQRAVVEDGEQKMIFVSLPFGIPVDTQDAKELKGSGNMRQLRKWQNELLEEVERIGNSLKPGEEALLAKDGTNGLAIQIRRVQEEVSADEIESGERFQIRLHGAPAPEAAAATTEQVTA